MTTLKVFCIFLMLCLFMPTASAVFAPTSTQIDTTIESNQKHSLKKEKTSFIQKQLLKKNLKNSKNEGSTEGVTVFLLGLAALVSFGIGGAQTGLLGILTALLFYGIGIVFGVLFAIFLVRWGMKQAKKNGYLQ